MQSLHKILKIVLNKESGKIDFLSTSNGFCGEMHRRDQDQQRLRPLIRGIYAFEDEETPEWRDVVLNGGIPKFDTKEQCEDFLRRYCSRGSNPEFPYLQHIFTMLVDEKQVRHDERHWLY